MKHYFIINPVAGKGKAVSIIKPQIEEYAKNTALDYEIHITTSRNEAISYVKEIASNGEPVRFYACGGDGTLYEIVNGAAGYDNAQVAVIPLGSGNDFVRLFGGREPFLNVSSLVEGTPIKLDLIKCGEYYAINQCSMGLDAEICAQQYRFTKLPFFSGESSYIAAMLYCFFRKVGSEFTISIDGGEPITQKVLFAVGANSRWYGGGFMPAPIAMPDDGLLDFVVVKKNMNRFRMLTLINTYKRGEHMTWDITKYTRGKKMTIKSAEPAAVNIDGECISTHEAAFEIIENGITFVVPSSSTYFEDIASGKINGDAALPR